MENNWPLNNDDGQGSSSLNPGNETVHLNWLNNLESHQDTMENDWSLNNNDGQGNSLNPGNETDHLNWLSNLEEYDMDAFMGADDHANNDQDEDDEEHHLQDMQSPKRSGKRFTAQQIQGLES